MKASSRSSLANWSSCTQIPPSSKLGWATRTSLHVRRPKSSTRIRRNWKTSRPRNSSLQPSCRSRARPVSYTHLRAHETRHDLVCRLLLEKKKKKRLQNQNTLKISTMKHKKKNENNK